MRIERSIQVLEMILGDSCRKYYFVFVQCFSAYAMVCYRTKSKIAIRTEIKIK